MRSVSKNLSPDTYDLFQRHQEERALDAQRHEVYEVAAGMRLSPGQNRALVTAAACYPGQGGMQVLRMAVVSG